MQHKTPDQLPVGRIKRVVLVEYGLEFSHYLTELKHSLVVGGAFAGLFLKILLQKLKFVIDTEKIISLFILNRGFSFVEDTLQPTGKIR
jgi:hypothetical protein